MIDPTPWPRKDESWEDARARGLREDAAAVQKRYGRHKVAADTTNPIPLDNDEVIVTYSCPICYREVTKVDFEGPWVHKNPALDPEESDEDY